MVIKADTLCMLRKSASNRVVRFGLAAPAGRRCSEQAEPRFDVDQPRNDARLGGVGMRGGAVALGDNAEPLGAGDAVSDGNAEAAWAEIVVLRVGAQFAALALRAWEFQRRLLTLVALIGAAGPEAGRAHHLCPHAADIEVVAAAGDGVETLAMRLWAETTNLVFSVWRCF